MHTLSVSKKEVGRAGDRLVSQISLGEKYNEEDVQILHEWRMLHLYPLNKILHGKRGYFLKQKCVAVL